MTLFKLCLKGILLYKLLEIKIQIFIENRFFTINRTKEIVRNNKSTNNELYTTTLITINISNCIRKILFNLSNYKGFNSYIQVEWCLLL